MKAEILSGVVAKDHAHFLVSYPPQVSVSRLIQKLKGKSSYKIAERISLPTQGEQRMCTRGYFGRSTENVSDKMIKDYIQNHIDHDDEV